MNQLPSTTALDLELRHEWLTIWLNEPDSRNALTDELRQDVQNVLTSVRPRRDVRGITLRGKGGVFCSGGDLNHFRTQFQSASSDKQVAEMSRDAAALFDLVNTAPQVVIALVEGAAMAGGFGLVCCADVVICHDDAQFAMTETSIGLSPAQIAPFALQKLGYATGRRLMLTGARFQGQEAHELGLADYTASTTSELESIENQLRRQVLRCAPGAVADTKTLLRDMQGLDRKAVIELAASNFASRMMSEEADEGLSAFFSKRKPNWTTGTQAR